LLGIFFDPEDGVNMFLRNYNELQVGPQAVIYQKIVPFIVTDLRASDPEKQNVLELSIV
jgi:hypothetical protein